MTQFLEFDEQRLSLRLGALRFSHQAVFVASCCERATPVCIEYSEMAYLEQEALLAKHVNELLWRAGVEPGARIQDRSLANELWRYARMDSDPLHPLSAYVADCVSALYFAADFHLTGSLKSATEAARWVYNALDSLVANRSGMTSGSAEEWRRLTADATIQRELRKQDRDLAALDGAERIDEPLVRRLREESARLGGTMLREFEAEAQTRLRRGPPPRIYPDC